MAADVFYSDGTFDATWQAHDAVWATAQAGGAAYSVDSGEIESILGDRHPSTVYRIQQFFGYWDTSAIGAGQQVLAGTKIELAFTDGGARDSAFDVEVYLGRGSDPLVAGDWGTTANLGTMVAKIAIPTGFSTYSAYVDLTNQNGTALLDGVDPTGHTHFVLVSSASRAGGAPASLRYLNVCTGDHATLKPKLTVVHGSAGVADAYNVTLNTALSEPAPGVLDNDTGGSLTAVLVDGVTHGTLALASDGSFIYSPADSWLGADTFTYQAFDGVYYSDETTVTLTTGLPDSFPEPPEPAITPEETAELIIADEIEVDYGLELLDENDAVIADISVDLIGGVVEHEGWASSGVFGAFHCSLSRELDWATARGRPYQTITGNGFTRTWYMGVFVPTLMPEIRGGEYDENDELLVTYPIEWADKCWLLLQEVGDTYVVASGVAVLDAVRTAITASGVTGAAPLIDSSSAKTLDAAMVFLLDPSLVWTWKSLIDALLKSVAYVPLWVDGTGRFRSRSWQDAATVAPLWTFDTSDQRTVIVRDDYKTTIDRWSTVNWWRFVNRAKRITAASEGDGYYTVDLSEGGTKRKQYVYDDWAGQAEMELAGDAAVIQATQRRRTLDIETAPFPVLEHLDVVKLGPDTNGDFPRYQVAHWKQELDAMVDCEIQIEAVQ